MIESQLLALDTAVTSERPWQVALIYGGRHQGFRGELPQLLRNLRLTLHEVPAVDYQEEQPASAQGTSKPLAAQLTDLLDQIGFLPSQTVVHVHNHSLGRNQAWLPALAHLAERGYALLLQIHDFAEDFRPANYARLSHGAGADRSIYPQAAAIHYAVLNGRDLRILREAGVAPGRVHLLPNPVLPPGPLPSRDHARSRLAERFAVSKSARFLLYPVRCIGRKNVGEALLYAALAPPDTVLGLTLPPLNPAELPRYEAWRQLAGELQLPCRFDVGGPGGLSFVENVAAADLILTTSLAEGFGMVFLESWLAGLPLVGRDLPEITADFTAWGVRFDWLGQRLFVPLEWIGVHTFQRMLVETYQRVLEAYRREPPPGMARQLGAKVHNAMVDFGDLDEPLQQQVLRSVGQSDRLRQQVLSANRWLATALSIHRHEAEVARLIEQNAQIISERLSLSPSGRRLLEVYRQVAASPRGGRWEPLGGTEVILEKFLCFDRFRPIRC